MIHPCATTALMNGRSKMTQGFAAVAQRQQNAVNKFLDTIQSIAGCTHAEAVKVYDTFRAARCLKLDSVGGQMRVKNGALLDADVLARIIAA
jgi:hypothetical protein